MTETPLWQATEKIGWAFCAAGLALLTLAVVLGAILGSDLPAGTLP